MPIILFYVLLLICPLSVICTKSNVFRNNKILQKQSEANIDTLIEDEYIIFFELSCLNRMQSSKINIINEFTSEYKCYTLNADKQDNFPDIIDSWIVMTRSPYCKYITEDDKIELEWNDYCIKDVEQNQYITLSTNDCESRDVNNDLWNLDSAYPVQSGKVEYINYDSWYRTQMDIIIMDSGIDPTHSEFDGITYQQLFDAFPGQTMTDHGTVVASCMVGKNYGTFASRYTRTKLLDVRVFGANGTTSDAIFNGYDAIIDYLQTNCPKKVVINLSFGGGNSKELDMRLEMIRSKGGIMITSAGNNNDDAANWSPASSPDVITVGNHDIDYLRRQVICPFPNGTFGHDCSSNYGNTVDIWAPGTDITVAIVGGGSTTTYGTSLAAPFVAGIVANMVAINYDLELKDIKRELLHNAVWDVDDRLGNENLPRAQISCNEYCTTSTELDESASYPSMDCKDFTNYVNTFQGEMDAYNDDYVFFNGIVSVFAMDKRDRIWQIRFCKPSGLMVPSTESITLPITQHDFPNREWYRGCGGNAAISVAQGTYSTHDNDRAWLFTCRALPEEYRLTNCVWTGYINDVQDLYMIHQCEDDGLIRTIHSEFKWRDFDRRYRVECCHVIKNSFDYTHLKTRKDIDYINKYEEYFDNYGDTEYICGQESIHDSGRRYSTLDRRFKWKYCKVAPGGDPPFIEEIYNLPLTQWEQSWSRSCGCINKGNAGIVGMGSIHQSITDSTTSLDDRSFLFQCGRLTTRYRLENCGWTGYLNNIKGDLNFDCFGNGVIRSISTEYYSAGDDRIWRFECCQVVLSEWMLGLTLGYPDNSYYGSIFNVRASYFNAVFHNAPLHIIKRECESCYSDYKEIYYRRFTDPDAFDAYSYMKQWKSANNLIHSHFELYSTFQDAVADENRWEYCNYDDVPNVGAFRDCAPTYSTRQTCQWTADVNNGGVTSTCNKPSTFYIYSGIYPGCRCDWLEGLTLGPPDNSYNGEIIDIGKELFNDAFQSSTYYIIKRECASCDGEDNKIIYYRRLHSNYAVSFDAYTYMKQWKSYNNIMNKYFALYSTLTDAIYDKDRWTYCNYDDVPNVGAFRDCAKTKSSLIPCDWTSDVNNGGYNGANCGKPTKFSIYIGSDFDIGTAAKVQLLGFDHDINQMEQLGEININATYFMYILMILFIISIICVGMYCVKKVTKLENEHR